jgi:hypothetical protein
MFWLYFTALFPVTLFSGVFVYDIMKVYVVAHDGNSLRKRTAWGHRGMGGHATWPKHRQAAQGRGDNTSDRVAG